MNILMVAAEMSPLAKVGGLADVVAALPSALARRGHGVRVVMPRYGHLALDSGDVAPWPAHGTIPVRVGRRIVSLRYWTWTGAPSGVTVDLVEAPGLFDRPGVYLHPDGTPFVDSLARYATLAQAGLMLPELASWPADVVHVHDAHTALVPIMRRLWYGDRPLPGAGRTLLTIHNLAHQELMAPGELAVLDLPPELAVFPGSLEFYGQANLLKGGILFSDRVNTVSPTYAREVRSDPGVGFGLDGVLASLDDRFHGILNGVDYGAWDPAVDPHLPSSYGPNGLGGKEACREALVAELGLDPAPRPLLGMVGRLVHQKGLDLLLPLLDRLAAGGYALTVLGSGEARYHEALTLAATRHPGRIAFTGTFDESLAHRIYGGCDLFLMPSLFEPCGLAQLYALRYGTPPLVRRTGGLADTVRDVGEPTGTGFVFEAATPAALWGAIERARALFADPAAWRSLQERGMACDFGWDAAATGYEETYRLLLADDLAGEG